jgi:hypothetical protein
VPASTAPALFADIGQNDRMSGHPGADRGARSGGAGRHAAPPAPRRRLLDRRADLLIGLVAVVIATTLIVSQVGHARDGQSTAGPGSAPVAAELPAPSIRPSGADPTTLAGTGTEGSSAVPSAGAPGRRSISLATSGAVGDGRADDTRAVQRVLDALRSGDTVVVPAGKTYRHTAVLRVHTPHVRITGGGTFLATRESRSAFFVDADYVTIDGSLTFRMASTTRRWDAYEQMKLRIGRHTGVVVSGVSVVGSAAAGIYVGGASHFRLIDVRVRGTRADGIHMTEGASYGTVTRAVVRSTGDDGIAVVSYVGSGLAHDITVASSQFYGQSWGRGFSVVGGLRVTYRNVYAASSSGAAIYIASEPGYRTYGNRSILVDGGTLDTSNANTRVGQGAVLVYNGQTSQVNSDITVRGLTIRRTRTGAPAELRVISDSSGCVQRRILFSAVTVVGGPRSVVQVTAPSSSYVATGIRKDGVALAAHIGW